jgi:hypothetical protein
MTRPDRCTGAGSAGVTHSNATSAPAIHCRRATARSVSTSPPQIPYRPMVPQCRSESSRHSARTGHRAHRASAGVASARAAVAVVATGNHWSGSMAAVEHLASGLITKPLSCSSVSSAGVARCGRLPPRAPGRGGDATIMASLPSAPLRLPGSSLTCALRPRFTKAGSARPPARAPARGPGPLTCRANPSRWVMRAARRARAERSTAVKAVPTSASMRCPAARSFSRRPGGLDLQAAQRRGRPVVVQAARPARTCAERSTTPLHRGPAPRRDRG